ncbi:hypothetical protein CBR_g40482 [Chara braunii]|uniref:CCHC-type domain-containing protein n=1 Tax=Chara braunii TaxID=69332 RepID=A0A388LU42_CHABU|nr:hypothetical protein CBR_g40482 [Chara braunii]|eukprot:GBG85753.1 hypothetical protein CBR_g40482 [Chara braunii]
MASLGNAGAGANGAGTTIYFNCNQAGHIGRDCPVGKGQGTFTNNAKYWQSKKESEDNINRVVRWADYKMQKEMEEEENKKAEEERRRIEAERRKQHLEEERWDEKIRRMFAETERRMQEECDRRDKKIEEAELRTIAAVSRDLRNFRAEIRTEIQMAIAVNPKTPKRDRDAFANGLDTYLMEEEALTDDGAKVPPKRARGKRIAKNYAALDDWEEEARVMSRADYEKSLRRKASTPMKNGTERRRTQPLAVKIVAYDEVSSSEAELLKVMKSEFEDRGLHKVLNWNPKGKFGNAYVLPKHKDLERWRPIALACSEPTTTGSRWIARALNYLLEKLPGAEHFNLTATANLKQILKSAEKKLQQYGKDTLTISGGFDIKEMFTSLPHSAIMEALTWLLGEWEKKGYQRIAVCKRRKQVTLGRKTFGKGYVKLSFSHIRSFISFELQHTYTKCRGRPLRQVIGVPMGKNSSPPLACLLCAKYEVGFLRSLGSDRKLVHGVRFMDDAMLAVVCNRRKENSVSRALEILRSFGNCYGDKLSRFVEFVQVTRIRVTDWIKEGRTRSRDRGAKSAGISPSVARCKVLSRSQHHQHNAMMALSVRRATKRARSLIAHSKESKHIAESADTGGQADSSNSYDVNTMDWLKLAGILFASGCILGPLLDGIHSCVDLVVYDKGAVAIGPTTTFALKTNFWVAPLLGAFHAVVGTCHVFVEKLAKKPGQEQDNVTSFSDVALSMGAMSAVLGTSSILYHNSVQFERTVEVPPGTSGDDTWVYGVFSVDVTARSSMGEMAPITESQQGADKWLLTIQEGCARLRSIMDALFMRGGDWLEVEEGAAADQENTMQSMLDIIWELEEGPAPQLDEFIDWRQAETLMQRCYDIFKEGRDLFEALVERVLTQFNVCARVGRSTTAT